MKKLLKRSISLLLAVCLLFSLAAEALASELSGGREEQTVSIGFDFDASNYTVSENGRLSVTVKRNDAGTGAAAVTFRAADLLSEYGVDYIIKDADGRTLEKCSGTKPDLSSVSEEADGSLFGSQLLVGSEPAATRASGESSSLLNAAAVYLDTEEGAEDAAVLEDTQDAMAQLTAYFQSAQGAAGTLFFAEGETEKRITVEPIDNSSADGTRLFMLALTGIESEDINAVLAPNPTTYVNLIDDEHAAACYRLSATSVTLTPDAPQAQITVTRTAGTNTFSTVYASTVSGSAPTGAYAPLEYEALSFLPGETEKTVSVSARDFSVGGRFGLRIEAADDAVFENSYVSIEIVRDASAVSASAGSKKLPLLAAGSTVLGNRYSYVNGETADEDLLIGPFDAGMTAARWPTYTNGNYLVLDNNMWGDPFDGTDLPESYALMIASGAGGMSTKNAVNLAGVQNVWIDAGLLGSQYEGAHGWGLSLTQTPLNKGSSTTLFSSMFPSTAKNKVYTSSDYPAFSRDLNLLTNRTGAAKNAPRNIKRSFDTLSRSRMSLDVSGFNSSAYLNFTSDYGTSFLEIYSVSMEHTLYRFKPQSSAETFTRSLYDLTAEPDSGTLYRQDTYYAGETSRNYRPSAVRVTYSGSNVTGFYSCANKNVVIAPSEPEKMAANGLVLKGVYFAKSTAAASAVPTGANAGTACAGMLYVPAQSGEIVQKLNADFVSALISAGVVSAKNPATEDIQIFPVYAHETVTAIFKTASDKVSDFYNLDGWWAKLGSLTAASGNQLYRISDYNGTGESVYAMDVDKSSIIRLYAHVSTASSTGGVCYAPVESSTDVSVAYLAKGSTMASAVNPAGIPVTADDFARAEINMTDSFLLYPCTGSQTITLRYFDRYKNGVLVPDSFRPDDLSGVVGYIDSSIVYDEQTGEVRDAETGELIPDYTGISGTDGVVSVEVLTGGIYSFYVVPPVSETPGQTYCVQWTNMTGDLNHDGIIDGETEENLQNSASSTENPQYLIGNRLNVLADQDNIQYYYQFVPLGSDTDDTKTGTLSKSSATFYELANNIPNTGVTVCPGCSVYIANWYGTTGNNGKYSIDIGNVARSGSLSASAIVDGITYNFELPSQSNNTKITLPAMYRFHAKSLKAYYGSSDNEADCSGAITVKDDTLTIKAEVLNSGVIRPADAKFEVQRRGIPVYTFTSEAGFDQNLRGGTATLCFNPKTILESGDRIFVSFCDEAGNWNPAIDLGIAFYSELTMDKVALPELGAILAGDTATDETFELLGSALCDLVLGSLGDLKSSNPRQTYPSGISADDTSVSWYETDYTYNFDTSLLPKFGKNSSEKAEQSDEDKKEDLKEETEKLKDDKTEVPDNSKGKAKTSSSFIWDISFGIGFRLTVSQRFDKDDNLQTYFEDMAFYVKANTSADINATVALPIGVSVVFRFQLDLNAVGIYRMYNNYNVDPYRIEGTLLYEEFNVFSGNSKISREGYIFIDPTIEITLGVKVGILTVSGTAEFVIDMDFCIGENSDCYGRLDIDLGWNIKILGFKVYSKSLYSKKVKLFGDDAFDYEAGQTPVSAPLHADSSEAFLPNTPTDRSYLDNRSEWMGEEMLLAAAPGVPGSEERTLMTGTADDPNMKVLDLGGGKALMVFVGDAAERTSVNKRAVYYSLSQNGGSTWSAPQIIDDDGTLDDYPDAFDLGNGEVLVTWSSVDTVLEDGASAESALRQLNLKSAFFDVAKMTFGPVSQLTKTTDSDDCADVLPHAAYDSESGRILLYYTKTEYHDIEQAEDFGKAESVTAFLFCDNVGGAWTWRNTGSEYSDDEIRSARDPGAYREQWYGQRFLDPRIDKTGSVMPLIVSSDTVCYNHLALCTWVADWDNDPSTADDRDVFLQIYNFKENTFTYNFRITAESGTYTLPRFLCTKDSTLLLYGALNKETDTDASGEGVIRSLNVSDAVANAQYTLYENGSAKYYTFTDSVCTDTLIACGNIEDYTALADSSDQLYLIWTDSGMDGRQICAAMLAKDAGVWSQPDCLTDSAGYCYDGISAAILNGKLFIGGGKVCIDDESDTALITLFHKPSSRVVPVSLSVSSEYPMPGETVTAAVLLKNEGLLPASGTYQADLSVNGGSRVSDSVTASLRGGETIPVLLNFTVPDSFDALHYTAVCNAQTVELTCDRRAALHFSGDTVVTSTAADGSTVSTYCLNISNSGNAAGSVHVCVKSGETVVGEADAQIDPRAERTLSVPLNLTDRDYTIDSDLAHADLTAQVHSGEALVYTGSASAYKLFDYAAVRALTSFDSPKISAPSAAPGAPVHETVNPVLPDSLYIRWQSSSDDAVVSVDPNGNLTAGRTGKASVSGTLLPTGARIVIGTDGRATVLAGTSLLPDYLIQTVSLPVTVKMPQSSDLPMEDEEDGQKEEPTQPAFADVESDAYYCDAVAWAAENGITTGTDRTHFSPDLGVTRAQVVTFLYRAAGCPDVSSASRFKDVVRGSYYETAVAWAVQNGITKGTGETTFSPERICTRAQIVTFLARFAGNADAAAATPFTDVSANAYYAAAVAWAVENGITKGTGKTTFSPDAPCTRAQVVTFLYRYMKPNL